MKNIHKIFLLSIFLIFISCDKSSKELEIKPNASNGQDALISSSLPFQNFNDDENIHLYVSQQKDSVSLNRVLIDFKEIPSNVTIDSAFLYFKFNNKSAFGKENYGENGFILSRVISPWDSKDVNWKNQPVTSNINQVYTSKTKLSKDPKRINVTRLVQDISSDKENSYGFMLKMINEKENAILLLASSNSNDESLRPRLSIFYSEKK
ncbi:hypothetical protein Q361_10175 [Flavobacterium croceum DSM 17960]|uniref:Carbohydrate-binding module family 96 domain-containing protein n=1 Tax=Flavobacterium croceum DSM 17960 TaxID=1121886 RepID=A0A2S4NBA6_9FLAO|nr:DNRLRE domain-containing protein [Flavobacterium croceum]POS02977.1 hypothetical protein Q361_10175 [Flavobacterium croceum DSM 17960]